MNNSPDDDIYRDYLDYMNNYNVKSLTNILGYYNINKNKLVKDEMVQLIILFENEPSIDLRKTLLAPSGEKVEVTITFGAEFFRVFF